ncbi:ELMO/CED-12 family protein [Nitzschia inconspicua]|uniref:ELMO/CED-12 family protein n=1 Tax=Nitzschia inconspicua TaxID=303405 RepID=A0A9K3L3M5_9STRA|nr:ELMO/CED-12 family protein [Nitzschia inconspicua]
MMNAPADNNNNDSSSTDATKSEGVTVDTSADASTSSTPTSSATTPQEHLRKTAFLAKSFADDAGRALGSFLPTASLQSITTRKYTLPDKTVASQVLMYRQLLHTKCRPGLKLSRPFQGTPAQKAVMHMPWWEKGIVESQKMVISYDNLISRLWLNGAIEPFQYQGTLTGDSVGEMILLDGEPKPAESPPLETFMTDEGLPPIPHEFWVDRLGFQQPDPVTDFRSGGVLSLAMLVYMVESKPVICQRFFTGDTAVLPFGITCINVTDMIAKFLMLAKSTDRMDALLSQKPFWKMFADPNAILAVQELAMSMLCDVAVELGQEKKVPSLAKQHSDGMPGDANDRVTVFDFSTILERTEKRVRDDLLGAGPKTVEELRAIATRLKVKYQQQLERKIQRARQLEEGGDVAPMSNPVKLAPPPQVKGVMDKATNLAGDFFAKVKIGKIPNCFNVGNSELSPTNTEMPEPSATIVDLPPLNDTPAGGPTGSSVPPKAPSTAGSDGDWTGADLKPATDAISNFSIGDEDDEDPDLLL